MKNKNSQINYFNLYYRKKYFYNFSRDFRNDTEKMKIMFKTLCIFLK